MRLADASFAAWIMNMSSMRCASTGMQPVWTRKTSAPRIDSSYRQYVSPFLNVSRTTSPSSSPRCCAIAFARSGCDRPAKTMSRFCGPRSIQCPWDGCVTVAFSSPGRASSAVRLSMLVVDPPFLCFLARREPCKRSRGDIICDDRTRRNPSIVANVHRCTERIVDTGPDVAPDPGLPLRSAWLVGEVGRNVAGRDVRVLADLGVPDIREVRDLR